MNKIIYRNIAIVSAIFIAAFSIMLITNYFQVKNAAPLQTEVLETLKKLNEENSSNNELQEQIRSLDLMARKAYFIRHDRLMTGAIILFAMLLVFFISLRLYFGQRKNIPDKQIDPIDDWAIKTLARKYVLWIAVGLGMASLICVVLTSPYLKNQNKSSENETVVKRAPQESDDMLAQTDTLPMADDAENISDATHNETIAMLQNDTDSVATEEPAIEISKVTHNGFRGNNSNGISLAK